MDWLRRAAGPPRHPESPQQQPHMPASRRLATLLFLFVAAGCDSPSTSKTPVPAAIAAVSGAVREGPVGAALPEPLVVRVTDADGRAVSGVAVQFVVTAGGGSLSDAQGVTDAGGEARTQWTLGTVAGDTQRVEARLATSSTPLPPAVFRAVGRGAAPGAPQRVGTAQRAGAAGAPLAEPLAVKVVDAFGNPLADVAVAWQVVAGGGTVTPASAVTGADGVAVASWSLGPAVGAGQQVRATTAQGTVDFGAVATLPGSGLVLQAESGSGQTGAAGSALAAPLVARVLLADGRPLQGVSVRWLPVAGTASPVQGVTDAAGRATAQWTLPEHAGPTSLTVGVPSTVVTATFEANVTAAAAASIEVVGDVQFTGSAGETLAEHPAVRLVDAYGNPVAGVAVSWEVVGGGGSVAAAATPEPGATAAQWTLGPAVGAVHQLRATSSIGTVDFAATGTFPGGVVLQAESGSGQTGQILTVLPQPVVARVLLADGRPLQGVLVRWEAAGTGQGSISPTEGVTGSTGRVSGQWNLPVFPGTLAFNATLVATGATAAFTATATPAPPYRVTGVRLASYTITAGDVLSLQARVTDIHGNALPGVTVNWDGEDLAPDGSPPSSVTDASGIATTQWTPTRRSYNRMVARTAATADTAMWRVFVQPGPITQILFTPRSMKFSAPGEADEFLIYTADQYGNRSLAASSYVLHLSSSNTAVATVPAQGSDYPEGWRAPATAEGPGTAVITATITELNVSGSAEVQVVPPGG
jgi:hypothetical protein